MSQYQWFMNCPRGLEGLLKAELDTLGAENARETVAGVYADGDSAFAYRVCLWSRFANRVLMPLGRFDVPSSQALYDGVTAITWQDHLPIGATIAVDFVGTNDAIRHSQYGAQRVKDAIVDAMVKQGAPRPNVELRSPDLRINAHLAKGRIVISLDLSGESLHRRGYRVAMVPAPLKENLAAAILVRAGWPEICARGGALIDPMCGSGTLLIEGALMAADIAPGLLRERFGFQGWKQYDAALWREVSREAGERRAAGLARDLPEIRGYDKDRRAVDATLKNIAEIGLDNVVKVICKPLSSISKPTHKIIENGLLVSNPPYGERWGDVESLRPLYRSLGDIARREFPGWTLGVFTGNPDLASELRLRSDRKYKFFNGTIPSQLLMFSLREVFAGDAPKVERPLSEQATMFLNRLEKNGRKLNGWLKRSGVTCYRLYDRDIPEYAVAVDVYGDAIHVQEYAPPANIDEQTARRRLTDIRRALARAFPDSVGRTYFKERRRQKGDSQYRRLATDQGSGGVFTVQEGAARLEVNLSDYLDTGLFLDHRPIRTKLAGMARGKRFLNLFCYTAAATVQAAVGGCVSSLSIDMSNTYLEWAARNFALNGIDPRRHELLRADCMEWLSQRQGQYDVIFLDPPTFSNSKKMSAVLDVQRDHVAMIDDAMAILAPGGTLIFSNNFRRFKLDPALFERYEIEDITAATLPPDFERNRKIHHCWLVHHRRG
ncbi:MAG: bifunctional 23S rRNA (guanine(2069)-N(7))-methyltransferase RlmK/23S rRNA (guanine(2445)-N(2))-methyltransferase RlmL [Porticoccaceae bacterium]|nr:bifunctional 23S rRNA (guanine(2069)-N(7))-methyltransferase RlmK/23S rRNA (guanine(2445)-N(2))-methyltransferase RlmL [Porticoccaceae bacterium]